MSYQTSIRTSALKVMSWRWPAGANTHCYCLRSSILLHFYTIHGNTYTLIIFNYFCKPSAAEMTIFCNLKKEWDQFSYLQVKIIFAVFLSLV